MLTISGSTACGKMQARDTCQIYVKHDIKCTQQNNITKCKNDSKDILLDIAYLNYYHTSHSSYCTYCEMAETIT